MNDSTLYLFCATLVGVSILYSCVGQAGASGYIAAMVLFGFSSSSIKPTALVLNVLVSLVVSLRFYRAGHFSWRLLWPFAASSIPAALVGGYITLSPDIFNRVLGALLLVAAFPFFSRRESEDPIVCPPPLPMAFIAGAGIGFLSGLTGVGGGVLITPLLLYSRWALPKSAAAVSAVFILINSVVALIGHLSAVRSLPPGLSLFAIAAVIGGTIGSQLGSVHFSALVICRVLGTILFLAGLKLTFC